MEPLPSIPSDRLISREAAQIYVQELQREIADTRAEWDLPETAEDKPHNINIPHDVRPMLEASGFLRIGMQSNLYAVLSPEPFDSVDHVRIAVVDGNGVQVTGDSIPWTMLLARVLDVMHVDERLRDSIIRACMSGL